MSASEVPTIHLYSNDNIDDSQSAKGKVDSASRAMEGNVRFKMLTFRRQETCLSSVELFGGVAGQMEGQWGRKPTTDITNLTPEFPTFWRVHI